MLHPYLVNNFCGLLGECRLGTALNARFGKSDGKSDDEPGRNPSIWGGCVLGDGVGWQLSLNPNCQPSELLVFLIGPFLVKVATR